MEEYPSNQKDFIFNQIENLLDKQQQEVLWYMEKFFTEDEMKSHSENLLQMISKTKSEIPFIKMQLLKREVNVSLTTYEELRKVGWQYYQENGLYYHSDIAFAKGALWLLDKLTPIADTKCVCRNCTKEFTIPKEKMFENYRQCTFCGSLKWDEMNKIEVNTCEERNESYAVIGEWTEPDGTEKWDVIHSGPISYEEALEISHLASKTWIENVPQDQKHLPHSEILIRYESLQNMKNETLKPNELGNNSNLLLPAVLLDEILTAIANYEEIIDGEWGFGRSAEQLIKDGNMPELYNKLLVIKNGR